MSAWLAPALLPALIIMVWPGSPWSSRVLSCYFHVR
jgi:hypothetical protein